MNRIRLRQLPAFVAVCLVGLLSGLSINAQTVDGALRMEVITAYNFVVDSNIESPAGASPSAAHLGVKVYNDGAVALTNVVVNIGKLTNPATSVGTPGLFEERDVTVAGANGYSGIFKLQMPGGAGDAVRVIPRIEPGEYAVQYFFVTYPLKDGSGNSVAGAAPDPSDDLWLNYDMWASANDGVTTRRVNKTNKVTMRNEISAMANKTWPNTESKVPAEYLDAIQASLGWRPEAGTSRVPGAFVHEGIWYDLGNVGAGFDNNGDGVPDRNAWVQPVGDPTIFSPLAARLVKCYGLVVVKRNDGTELLIPFEDRLYFENLPADNTGAVGLVYYEFLPLNTSLPSQLTPYQEVASGYDNEKFNSDFGLITGVANTGEPEVAIDKTGPATREIGQNADYAITVTNTGEVDYGWPDLGLPIVIEDPIPAGLTYVTGSAASAANVTNPAGGIFTVYYSTDDGASWSMTEPGSGVNRLRWVLDRKLTPAQTATVEFSATVPLGYDSFNFTNTGILKTGTDTEVARSIWTTVLTGNNSVGDFVWRDLDRDGAQDGGAETGIADVGVSLYVDVNGNGLRDSGDVVYRSVSTDGNGAYLFSDLPDLKYIVAVDSVDSNIPFGFTLEQGVSADIAVDLDSAAADVNPVDILNADWPFIQALEVTKRVSPTTYNEGSLVHYFIDLENNMSTVAPLSPPLQTAYVTSVSQTTTGGSAGASVATRMVGAPDNSYGFLDWQASSDVATSSGLDVFGSTTGTISKVELVIRGYLSRTLVNDTVEVSLGHSGAAPTTLFHTIPTATLNTIVGQPQDIVIDVTNFVPGVGAWTWTQAQGLRAALKAAKVTSGDIGDYYIDSISFRVTATTTSPGILGANSITQLPLVDTFDPSQLEFVSASVSPDSTSPAGTLSWTNLGPLNPGARTTIEVTFRALAPVDTNNDGTRDPATVTNTATSNGSRFANDLPAGNDSSSVDITVLPRASIGDFVYWDINANAIFDAGDVPLSNVIVQLYQRSGVNYVFTGATAVTDADGYYQFAGLADVTAADAYQVRITKTLTDDLFSLPWTTFSVTAFPVGGSNANAGFVNGPDVIVNNSDAIPANDVNMDQDFAFDSTASLIAGRLFMDRNGDGIQGPGEEPLIGYTVRLTVGATTVNVTTNADGEYRFNNVTTTGDHTVTVIAPPAGTVQTLDPDGTLNSNTLIAVVAGNAYLDRDFAYMPTGALSIGDTVYYDWNGNGTQDVGEEGIANIDVRLYEDANGDGTVNLADDALIATDTTDSSGVYGFGSLVAGNYIVVVETSDSDFPVNYNQTQDFDGTFDDKAKVNLIASLATVDFGYQPTGSAVIGNLVWLDSNNNGLKDPLESGINGVAVELYRVGKTPGVDAPTATTTTAGGGLYSFTGLAAGGYYVYLPAANFSGALASYPWSSTTTSTSDDDLDNDDNGIQTTGGTAVVSPLIALGSGEDNATVDFGFTGTGSAGDFVFYDVNGNGGQDFNEPGIPGVTVKIFVDANQDGQPDSATPVATTVTSDGTDLNPVGFYRISNLVPGYYFLEVDTTTLPAGVTLTCDPDRDGIPVGSPPALPAGDDGDSLVLVAISSTYSGGDFGYQPTGAVGDFVWLDLNQDGVQDPGEPGLANVEIEISDGVTTYPAVTDFDGYWSAVLPNGNWTVTVLGTNFDPGAPLEAMLQTYDADGTASANETDLVVTGGVVVTPAALAQGNFGIDFGYRLNGAYGIAGTVIINDAGVPGTADDSAETPLEGVEVYLYIDGGMYLGSVPTDEDGNYSFTGLPAGDYRVVIGTTDPPLDYATLTTTAANNPAVSIVDVTGTSVIQTLTIVDAPVSDVDFAFVIDVEFDFGDLPASYAMTTLGQDGARHIIPTGGSTVWLGSAGDAELDGVGHPQALSDDLSGSDDEDGVAPVAINTWADGTVGGGNGGAVEVAVNGSGWLVGWIDWNQDGDFFDVGDFVVSQAVTAGLVTVNFDIPAGTITGGQDSWMARFRIFTEEPPFAQFSLTGQAIDGEVEDYQFSNGSDLQIVKSVDDSTPNVGQNVTFTIEVTNNGPADATGVEMTDLLPDGYEFVSSSETLNSGVWTIGNLANGASVQMTIVAKVLVSGTYLNTASVDGEQDDPTPGNNEDDAETTPERADLSIVKTVDEPLPAVGDNVVFTLEVTNNGPSDATGVEMTDLLPDGYEFVSSSETLNSGVWTIGNLANGASVQMTITAKVLASGTYLNSASVDGEQDDPNPDNNQDDAEASPNPRIDLAILKTVDNETPNVGSNVVFTIEVSNNGPSDATGVEMTDLLPDGYEFVSSSETLNSGVWSIGNLASGASTQMTITAKVLASGTYLNTATVDGTEEDTDPDNNSDDAETDPTPQVDLAIVKTVDNGTPNVGSNVVFTIEVSNNGPSDATGVEMTDLLPDGYEFVSSSETLTNGVWSIGNLANGGSVQMTITAKVLASGTYLNTATVDGTEEDTDPDNNSDDAETDPTPQVDLAIVKTVDNGTPNVGSNVVFTIEVSNNGPSDATGVEMTDLLPDGYEFVSSSETLTNGVWSIGNLANGGSVQMTITAKVLASGTYLNTATVDGVEDDTDPLNNTDDAETDPTPQIDLAVVKTVDEPLPNVGDNVIFTIQVSNNGPSDATGVEMTDLLPDGYEFFSSSETLTNGVWSIGNLANGGSVQMTITAKVLASGTYLNTATVDGFEDDTDPLNNTDDAETDPIQPGSITGTVRADTDGNGSGDINLLGVTLNLLDNSGQSVLDEFNVPRTTTTDANGFYSFSGVIPGSYQIAEVQPDGYGSLSDSDGGNPNLISNITVTAGTANTGNDFLEFLQKCPDTWEHWQEHWVDELGEDNIDPLDNPDGDRYDNLTEYAFCLPPNTGVRKPFCLVESLSVPGGVDGVYTRTAGGPHDIEFVLEYAPYLVPDPVVQEWVIDVTDQTKVTLTNNGNGTETIRLKDLETITGNAGAGFVRIRVDLIDPDTEEVIETSGTEVLGWVETAFGLACQTYNNPVLRCSTFTGTIDSIDGQDLVVTTSAGPMNLATVLDPNLSYYVEVVSGAYDGHRFDVVSASGGRITLASDTDIFAAAPPFNTMAGALPIDLAGARISLRRHWTLDQLFPPTSFGATGSQTTADQIQIFAGGAWSIYWLYDDAGTPRWVRADDAGLADQGKTVVMPGQGMFFNNRTAPFTWLSFGEVRENSFVRPLAAGSNLVGGGYPVDQSATGAGSRQFNLADGFFGEVDFKKADSFFVWRGDANPAAISAYETYYLASKPTPPALLRWVKMGDASAISRDAELLLKRDRSVFLRTKDAHPSPGIPIYKIASPWGS